MEDEEGEQSQRRVGQSEWRLRRVSRKRDSSRGGQDRKVISHIGSSTNIRGGHVYPALIRKGDKRPIRVFLQDGDQDLNNQHGNWWLSNLQMDKALKFWDYDYKLVPGKGGHNGEQGGAMFPDTLRWIWREESRAVLLMASGA